ncbi:hypothetical protein [Streptomyces sp. NPDC047070]|uniref:hypothetical protein n=1 Tax=Streptomyces sp. NPDC047070 TaxID=3154923 RepID=UPI0034533A69
MPNEWSMPAVGDAPSTGDTVVTFSATKQWGSGYEEIYQVHGSLQFSDSSGNGTESVADRAAVVLTALRDAGYTANAYVTAEAIRALATT